MRFQPGQSGNPGGRPKVPDEVRQAARLATPQAIATLVCALDHELPRVRILAADKLLQRAWGSRTARRRAAAFLQSRVA